VTNNKETKLRNFIQVSNVFSAVVLIGDTKKVIKIVNRILIGGRLPGQEVALNSKAQWSD